MITEPRKLADELLRPLCNHFAEADKAYVSYIRGGNAFIFAQQLRGINESARDILLKNSHMLPEELQSDTKDLLHHYEVWMRLWDDLAETLKPAHDDRFVFENTVRFPHQARRRLTQELVKLEGTGIS